MQKILGKEYYVTGILKGDVAVLGRAITLIESNQPSHIPVASAILDAVMDHTGRSFRLGVTGVPGVGKSTFIETLGAHITRNNKKLAVLAIDPTSSKSGGSILGDKTRMEKLAASRDVFIRPSPSGGELGGVGRATFESILLCEAAGYDFVIVETVGVGQSESYVSHMTDFFLLLLLAGGGDELQGIKRGIMEMADAVVINKADGENKKAAKEARSEFARALHFLMPSGTGWIPPVLTCSAIEDTGVEEVLKMVFDFESKMRSNGSFDKKRSGQGFEMLKQIINKRLLEKEYREMDLTRKLEEIRKENIKNPFSKARELLAGALQKRGSRQ